MSALTTAWQAALAAEQRAAFGYSVLGPHLTGSDLALAVECSDAHEALRDATAQDLAAAGFTPVAPAADYPSLYPVPNAARARALALRLEETCADAWRYLYLAAASSRGVRGRSLRGTAQDGLTASAVRATRWRALVTPAAPTTPFPGT